MHAMSSSYGRIIQHALVQGLYRAEISVWLYIKLHPIMALHPIASFRFRSPFYIPATWSLASSSRISIKVDNLKMGVLHFFWRSILMRSRHTQQKLKTSGFKFPTLLDLPTENSGCIIDRLYFSVWFE